jgi:hypothetical protein
MSPDTLLTQAFSGSQLANARVIVREFLAAGHPLQLALAAVVNAHAESGLNASIAGDGGQSVGLFQINALKGKRTFTGDRKDPVYNTRWIINEVNTEGPKRTITKGGSSGQVFQGNQTLFQALQKGASVSELAGLFGAYIERPDRVVSEYSVRKASARKLFPTVADLSGFDVGKMGSLVAPFQGYPDSSGVSGSTGTKWWLWLIPIVTMSAGVFVLAKMANAQPVKLSRTTWHTS